MEFGRWHRMDCCWIPTVARHWWRDETVATLTHLKFGGEEIHVYSDIVSTAKALARLPTILNPANACKIGWLCTIEPSIEASVITIGKGDNELALFLDNLPISNTYIQCTSVVSWLQTLLNGMEYCLSTDGEIIVILCRKKLWQSS